MRKKQFGLWCGFDLSQENYRIKKCNRCGAEIVWLRSKKGKNYPVNFNGLIDVMKNDFHKCN